MSDDAIQRILEEAEAKWASQGRTEEQKYAARNFMTGAMVGAAQQIRQYIETEIIDTNKTYYYVKGKTDIETVDNITDVDRICEIREELREEQRRKLK